MRALSVVVMLLAGAAWPCDLAAQPNDARAVDAGIEGSGDAGTPPSQPIISRLGVALYEAPCDGSGSACPQIDVLSMNVQATDDATPPEGLRYVAAFGATAEEADMAPYEIIFRPGPSGPTTVSAFLGQRQQRSGAGFAREMLCFALAAVDEAGQVGPRSSATCLNTTDKKGQYVTLLPGDPSCVGGCGCQSGTMGVELVALAALLWRRERGRVRTRERSSCPGLVPVCVPGLAGAAD